MAAESFEPPKYIDALIKAINDGARAAQAGLLFLSLVALYLLATSFATTDEDLLLNRTTVISQIGVAVPVLSSFLLAPLVFLALHAFALIRYDMLAANLRHFNAELAQSVPLKADRERCRQLLANVEFVQALTAPRGSPLRSLLFGPVAVIMFGLVPVLVLLALQISAVRYQNETITNFQRAAVFGDLLLLAWFADRFCIRSRLSLRNWRGAGVAVRRTSGWLAASVLVALVVYSDLRFVRIPDPDNAADVDTVTRGRASDVDTVTSGRNGWPVFWSEALIRQPLDLGLCPRLGWGCRFLRVDHRPLVAKVWKDDAIVRLRLGKPEDQTEAQRRHRTDAAER